MKQLIYSQLVERGGETSCTSLAGKPLVEGCYKIIISGPHPLYRSGLKQAITRIVPDSEFIEAGTMAALYKTVEQHCDANLVVFDLDMQSAKGFTGLVWLKAQKQDLPIVVISSNNDPKIMNRAITYGASGFIPKSSPVLQFSHGITSVLAGGIWLPKEATKEAINIDEVKFAENLRSLTPKQFDILMKICQGMYNKQISYALSIKEATVKTHITAVLKKLQVYTRTQAVISMERLQVKAAPLVWE